MNSFSHIPESEKQKQWFRLWKPIIEKRMRCNTAKDSELLKLLAIDSGIKTWRVIKNITEYSLEHCQNTPDMFSDISSKIRFEADGQEEIIKDLLAELRAPIVLYLLGFGALRYFRKNALDFSAILFGNHYKIEVSHIRGEAFKTQEKTDDSLYKLTDENLIMILQRIYRSKVDQVRRHGVKDNAIIFIDAENLNETDPFWLNHIKYNQSHPIQFFVDSCEIPTIVWANGVNLYIPLALQAKVNPFDKAKYVALIYDLNLHTIEEGSSKIRKIGSSSL